MILLAIDSSASLCAACVYDAASSEELGREVLDLGKGHAEHLMGVIAGALERAGKDYADIGALAVSVGPGSFTGVRVGVSAARGLALALKVPAIGVTTLEALATEGARAFPDRAVLAALDAGRGEIHAALYDSRSQLRYGPAVAGARRHGRCPDRGCRRKSLRHRAGRRHGRYRHLCAACGRERGRRKAEAALSACGRRQAAGRLRSAEGCAMNRFGTGEAGGRLERCGFPS